MNDELELVDKGARRQFIATSSLTLLNLRWTTEIYLKSLESILRNEPDNTNFLGQQKRTEKSFKLITAELKLRKVLVPYDMAETMELCERYDVRHWGRADLGYECIEPTE